MAYDIMEDNKHHLKLIKAFGIMERRGRPPVLG